jgi:hypothetical protein
MIVMLSAMIIMVPVPLMQLPPLLVVIIVRMVPLRPFVRRMVPAPRHPAITISMRGPVSIHPGIAHSRHRPTPFNPQRRWCDPDVYPNLRESRQGENRCDQYVIYPMQFHGVSPVEHFGGNRKNFTRLVASGRGVLLASSFNSCQNAESYQYESAHHDPMGGHVHQARTVNKARDHDHKTSQIDSE